MAGDCLASPGYIPSMHVLVENDQVFIALPLYNNGLTFWKIDSLTSNSAHEFREELMGPDWGNN